MTRDELSALAESHGIKIARVEFVAERSFSAAWHTREERIGTVVVTPYPPEPLADLEGFTKEFAAAAPLGIAYEVAPIRGHVYRIATPGTVGNAT